MKTSGLLLLAAILICSPRPTFAENGGSALGLPFIGFVFEKDSAAVRPVSGIPGAALVGNPLHLGFPAKLVANARNRSALVVSSEDGLVRLIRNGGSSVEILADVTAGADLLATSRTGSAALIYSRTANTVQVITGLPDAVAVRRVPVPEVEIRSISVSDDGVSVLMLAAQSVWLSRKGSEAPELILQEPVLAGSFRSGTTEAFLVSSRNEVLRLHRADDVTTIGSIAVSTISSPISVQSSKDGGRLFLASSDGMIAAFQTDSGTVQTIACSCTSAGLSPTNADDVFRIDDGSASPVFLLDGSGEAPRIRFVPQSTPVDAQGDVR